MISVQVLGVEATLAKFAETAVKGAAAAEVGKTVLSEDVAGGARAMAPVDTGALRDSIAVTENGVGVGVPYASFVEYGTSDTPAQPYLRPAADTVDYSHTIEAAAAVVMS